MKNLLTLCIVIPTFNRKDYLKNVLIQIQKQEPESVEKKVIVVVDGSTDGTIEMLKEEFPDVYILLGSGSWWYTKCMNEGFKLAEKLQPDYVLTLNDDVKLKEDYLSMILESRKKVEKDSIVGSASFTFSYPHMIDFSGISKYISWRQKYKRYHPRFKIMDPEDLSGIYPSVVLPGRGMLIPTVLLKKLNYFDEYFVQYHSDEDFCLRARQKGYKSYISWDAQLFTHTEKTGEGMSFIKTGFGRFLKAFFNKYSRIYIPHRARFYYKHGMKICWPVTMITFFASNLKAYFFNKKLS